MSEAPRKRPTIRDVARVAGTSIKTVSRVLNREGNVREELTRRVESAIEQLGYRRDEWARRLRAGDKGTDTIGLVVLNLGDPFFGAIAEGVESVASERGVLLLVASSDASPGRQDELVEMLVSRRVDGLVLVPVGGDLDMLAAEIERGTPVVFVDMEPARKIGDAVLSDHKAAAITAVSHLISNGHSRIGFLGPSESVQSGRLRYEGYKEALMTAGLDFEPELVAAELFHPSEAAAAVDAMLESAQPPTALFSAYWGATVGAIGALQRRGARHHVALVSSDDIDTGELLSPGLTATPQDPFEIGRSAAGLLFQRLDGYDGPPETIKLALELVPRGSGEIAPAEQTRRTRTESSDT